MSNRKLARGYALLTAGTAIGAALLAAAPAQAVLINNGSIFLGVNADGSLNDRNVTAPGRTQGGVGLFDGRRGSYYGPGLEATFDGCTCEGWGVASFGAGVSGYANTDDGGAFNMRGGIVSSTANSLTSTVIVSSNDVDYFQVTHQFLPSQTADLYRVNVFIKNLTEQTLEDVVYRRVMDWDVEPTPFNEYVTIGGTHSGPNGEKNPYLRYSSNDGFASADPLTGPSSLGAPETQDFTQYGIQDHGALFDFTFGNLAAGVTQAFTIFYGASATTESAMNSLSQVGAEIYSLAYASGSGGDTGYGGGDDGYGGGGGGEGSPTLTASVAGPGDVAASAGPGAEGPNNSVFIFAFDIDNNGSSFEQPFLPNGDSTDGSFEFQVPVQPGVPVVIDPVIAIGYDYTADYDVLSVQLEDLGDPNGYIFEVLSGGVYTRVGGPGAFFEPYATPLIFADYGFTGVRAFRISDIAVDLELSPTDTTAFKTKLLLDVPNPTLALITQDPIKFDTDAVAAVPEPASWAMMILGFGLVGAAARRRRTPVTA